MGQSPGRRGPAYYELRVDGHLDDHWSACFGDLTLTHDYDGTTSLSGPVSDQAELHGLLMKVRDLGVVLISVTIIDRVAAPARRSGCVLQGDGDAEPSGHRPGLLPVAGPEVDPPVVAAPSADDVDHAASVHVTRSLDLESELF
jgi:hypothetical protein